MRRESMKNRMLLRVVIPLAAAAIAAIAPQTGHATQVFVKGTGTSIYFLQYVPYWLTIGTYETSGYKIERGMPDWEGRVRITVTANAELLASRAPYKMKEEQIPSAIKDYLRAAPRVPTAAKPFKKIAEDLVKGCKYQSDAVEAILSWIGENFAYDQQGGDEDPTVVLEKKRGHCVGLSNLALTLLRSAGIPARPVQGLLLTQDGTEGSETRMDFQLHRFIEVYYPDIGWVFSDPQKTVNFVSQGYLYWREIDLAAANNNHPEIERLRIFRAKEVGGLIEDDMQVSEAPSRVFVRKNLDLRYTAAIQGVLQTPDGKPFGGGQISINSSSGTTKQVVRADGSFSFVGLKGGEYSLQFSDSNHRYLGQRFKLKDREARQITITVERIN